MNTNYTPEENYRIYGALPNEQMCDLLDGVAKLEKIEDTETYIEEAKGCFMSEDFMHEELNDLNGFAKTMRGERKDDFLGLIQRIEDQISAGRQESEHGIDQLKQALKAMA